MNGDGFPHHLGRWFSRTKLPWLGHGDFPADIGLGNPSCTCQEGVEARYDFFLNRDQGRDRMLPGGSGNRGVDVQWRNANCDFPEKSKKSRWHEMVWNGKENSERSVNPKISWVAHCFPLESSHKAGSMPILEQVMSQILEPQHGWLIMVNTQWPI